MSRRKNTKTHIVLFNQLIYWQFKTYYIFNDIVMPNIFQKLYYLVIIILVTRFKTKYFLWNIVSLVGGGGHPVPDGPDLLDEELLQVVRGLGHGGEGLTSRVVIPTILEYLCNVPDKLGQIQILIEVDFSLYYFQIYE